MSKSPAQLRQLDKAHVELRLAYALRLAGARQEAILALKKAAIHRKLYRGIPLTKCN